MADPKYIIPWTKSTADKGDMTHCITLSAMATQSIVRGRKLVIPVADLRTICWERIVYKYLHEFRLRYDIDLGLKMIVFKGFAKHIIRGNSN